LTGAALLLFIRSESWVAPDGAFWSLLAGCNSSTANTPMATAIK